MCCAAYSYWSTAACAAAAAGSGPGWTLVTHSSNGRSKTRTLGLHFLKPGLWQLNVAASHRAK